MEEIIMGFYADTKADIEYTDNNGTTYFNIGDKVACYTDRARYSGRITQIGTYLNAESTECFPAVYVDTSKSETSISGEIIFIKEIRYMYKYASDETGEQNKKDFVESLRSLGYGKELSEQTFDRLQRIIYDCICTISKITVCIDYAVKNHCSVEEALKQMCNVKNETDVENELIKVKEECTDTMEETCRNLINVFMDLLKEEKNEPSVEA